MSEPTISTKMKIASRKDVPNDVKQLVAKHRVDAKLQKQRDKRRIARLESQVAKAQETVKNLAARQQSAKVMALTQPSPSPPQRESSPITIKPWRPPVTFEERMRELEHFQRGNGHCRVPLRQPGLGRFVGEMRTLYKAVQNDPSWLERARPGTNDLTRERIDRLNALGFEWQVGKPTVPWQQRYHQLIEFKEKNGHTRVPRHWEENPSLGEWVHMQRKLHKQGAKSIQGERTDKLNAIGFQWSTGTVKPTFDERLEECRNFRRKHGHLKVPPPVSSNRETAETYRSQEEKSFRSWAQRQRDEYRKFHTGLKVSLDKARINKLDELGFDWESEKATRGVAGEGKRGKPRNEDVYNERLEQLKQMKEQFGDCNDINTFKKAGYPENSALHTWVKAQRRGFKNLKKGKWSGLTPERIAKLEALGFDFEPRKHYAPAGSVKAAKAARRASATSEGPSDPTEESDSDDEGRQSYGV